MGRKLERELLSKPGLYKNGKVKKSYQYIADYFGVSISEIKNAIANIKYNTRNIQVHEESRVLAFKTPSTKSDIFSIDTEGTYWVTGCAHAPFHNKRMYDATFNFLNKEIDLKGVILNGDILDMHSISRHNRGNINPVGVNLEWEYKESNKFLNEIQDLGDDTLIRHYLFGNHEKWYYTALKDIDTSKYGEALKSPVEALKLIDRGYTVQTDYNKAHINFGKHLEINHGEFVNVHCAKKTIDTYRKSILFNHTHRFQIYMEGLVGGFNMGWGGDQNAPVFGYATRAMKNSWVNASALVTLDKEGGFYVQPLLFLNNKLIVNGKEY